MARAYQLPGQYVVERSERSYQLPAIYLTETQAAAGGGDPEGPLIGGKLIRGGMLMRGRLVG